LNTATANGDQRKRLNDFLKNLKRVIEGEAIQSEVDLEKFFQVENQTQLTLLAGRGYNKQPENATLLEILGYEYSDVEDHPQKKVSIASSRYSPDYILKRNGKRLAIVDLKTPEVNLDRDKWAGQVCYYCHMENVPIGFLFNGRSLRVFVNVEFKGLTKYAAVFKEQPVAEADMDNEKQMVDLLLKFAATHSEENPVAIARGLANQRLKELRDKAQKKDIENRLKELLASPPDEMLKALPDLSIWGDIPRKPSVGELFTIRDAIVKEANSPRPPKPKK